MQQPDRPVPVTTEELMAYKLEQGWEELGYRTTGRQS